MSAPTHLAVIWWWDAHFESGEVDPRKPEKSYEKISAGLLIQDDKYGVRVAQDYNVSDRNVEAVTFVPRAMIQRVLRWKVPG